jgi:hypothetical protein
MIPERAFQITLLISLITHTVIFLNNPDLISLPKRKNLTRVEVAYLKNPPHFSKFQKKIPPQDNILKISPKIKSSLKPLSVPPLNRNALFNINKAAISQESNFVKPFVIKTDIIAVRKKITLPPIEINKINNPSYVSYYQLVREKIRRAAYQNYTHTETGEIYLAFLISNTGILKDIRLIEEKSAVNFYLKDIALRSIKDAAPFPPFPKELDYPQLSFNVIISFQIE